MPSAPKTHHIVGPDLTYRRQVERERQVKTDERRGTAAERGYDGRWQKTSKGYLRKHPLCCCCEANGRVVPAGLVDHVVPHKGSKALFWERDNWQGLCERCHRVIKPGLERRWMLGEIDADKLRLTYPMPQHFVAVI